MLLAAACSGDQLDAARAGNDRTTTAVTSATAHDSTTTSDPTGPENFAGRVWHVVGVVEGDVVQPPPPGVEATLLVEGGQISGSAGCNSYSGAVEVDGISLRVGSLSLTERGCVDTTDWLPFIDTLMRARSLTAVGDGYVIEAVPKGAIVLQ